MYCSDKNMLKVAISYIFSWDGQPEGIRKIWTTGLADKQIMRWGRVVLWSSEGGQRGILLRSTRVVVKTRWHLSVTGL